MSKMHPARSLAALTLAMTLASMKLSLSRAEEQSILAGAKVSSKKIKYFPSAYLIDGKFGGNYMAHSDSSSDYNGSKEFTVFLSSEKKIVSAFVVNRIQT